MALSEQDREWVRSIVAEAISAATASLMTYTHKTVDAHAGHCPNVSRLKYILIGIGIALTVTAGSAASAPLVKLLLGT